MAADDATTTSSTILELSFRLDEEGRTAPTTTDGGDGATPTHQEEEDKPPTPPTLNYTTHTIQTSVVWNNDSAQSQDKNAVSETACDGKAAASIDTGDTIFVDKEALWDELLLDTEMADSGLLPRTFWIGCNGMEKPRCSLEQFALDIFHHHVPKDAVYDRATSGAEWWVQIRPHPVSGRYRMHAASDLEGDDMAQHGVWFHWDKDEDLRQIMGGDTTYLHPHLSTVTYFTAHGAPTLAVNRRIHPLQGVWLDPTTTNSNDEAFVSWPRAGKHLAFDGRFLHAAPPDLIPAKTERTTGSMEDSLVATNKETEDAKNPVPQDKKVIRRQRRVTFLVNIWLNHHPLNVHPFPGALLDKLSGSSQSTVDRAHLVFASQPDTVDEIYLETKPLSEPSSSSSSSSVSLEWPMGGQTSGEIISIPAFPLYHVQRDQVRNKGGNVKVMWKQGDGIRLWTKNPAKKARLEG